jgi:hypothetical protein
MFRDGWVCVACWKPNRASDSRCYACKTAREQQATVEAGSLAEKVRPGSHLVGRLDARVPFLAMLAAWPMRAAGAAGVGIGSLGLLLTMLSRGAGQPPVFGLEARLFVGLVMIAVVLFGVGQIFLANSVQRHARWAYGLTILIGLIVSATRLLDPAGRPAVMSGLALTVYIGAAWLYLAMAILAAALLVASFLPAGQADTTAR